MSGGGRLYHNHLSQALNAWGNTSPHTALRWHESTLEQGDFELPSLTGAEKSRDPTIAGLISDLFVSDEILPTEAY